MTTTKWIVLGILLLTGCSTARTRNSDPVMRVAIDADSMPPGSYARLVYALVQSGRFVVVDRAAGFRAIAKEQEIQHTTTRFGNNEKYALWGRLYGVGGIFIGAQQCEHKTSFIFQNPYQACVQNLNLINATTGEVMAVAEVPVEGAESIAVDWTDSVDQLLESYPKKFRDTNDLHRTIDYDSTLQVYRNVTVPENSKPSRKMDADDHIQGQ